jgi:hypothetical protein
VGIGSSAQIVYSTDQYSYPAAPSVTGASGCSPKLVATGNNFTLDYTQTVDCPTEAVDSNGDPLLLTLAGACRCPCSACETKSACS